MLLNTYNIVFNQSSMVYDNLLFLQGQKIADRYFQKIESELLGDPPVHYFSKIETDYSNIDTTMTVNNVIFNINLDSNYCDSLGASLVFPNLNDTLYQKLDIRINCLSTSLDTLYIGTLNSPFSKVFINRGF
ncbi:MAG: hypothetical protein DRI84_05780 [Bacteroidetes bacterium]|nr:MAG: hypothetical protein DRI84_05780 [Bacteroidota bacterium]